MRDTVVTGFGTQAEADASVEAQELSAVVHALRGRTAALTAELSRARVEAEEARRLARRAQQRQDDLPATRRYPPSALPPVCPLALPCNSSSASRTIPPSSLNLMPHAQYTGT